MKKEVATSWKNVPFKTWEYEPQTEMKHKVLKYYLPVWAKILGHYSDGLNYIDGFGGIGAYHNSEDLNSNEYKNSNYGSPIFSIQTISELKSEGTIKYANVVVIDEDEKNIRNLQEIVNYLGIKNTNIDYINGDFDFEINEILDELQGRTPYPTFFLIDPFGFSIKIKTIERMLRFDRTEVLINFMYNAIGRHVHHPNEKINKLYDELFGTPQWRLHADKIGEEKELALVNLFRNQCKKIAKFVYPFKLNFPEQNRPYYYLFHLSNHHLGCKLMKEAFAANNFNEFEYTGKIRKEPDLFDLIDKHESASIKNLCTKCFIPNKNKLCEICIIKSLNVNQITFEDFYIKFVDILPFTEKEIKKMLNDFEKKGKLIVKSNRNRRTGFENGDILCFQFNGD